MGQKQVPGAESCAVHRNFRATRSKLRPAQ
ncbi:hypothetical protein A2U01_0109924, partial [Trifolium medium]|nr:hypothetical protein [Trifolium medium]